MNISRRIRGDQGAGPATTTATLAAPNAPEPYADRYQAMKKRLHRELIGRLDLSQMEHLSDFERRQQVEGVARQLLVESDIRLTRADEERLLTELMHDTFDLGPITPLMYDEEISDILVNSHRKVYVERLGKLEETAITFRDDAQLRLIIDRIISRVGRRIDESMPLVDARLPDGSRVNAIIPPAALDGPVLSIRRFRRQALSIDDLLAIGTLTQGMAEFLTGAVRARLNIMISGGTGTGKTTMLNIVSRYISSDERIVTIEDSAELMLQQPHIVRLETRPANIEGRGLITQRDLLRNTLRMRPDRIIIGEVRGDEVLDMLQSMNTGHDGSLTTLHANSPRDALHRLENLVLMAGHNLPDRAIREQIANAIDLVIHVARMSDGSRRVLSVQEVLGMEGPVVTMQEIFKFVSYGIDADGRVVGEFQPTGIVPRSAERLRLAGIALSPNLFTPQAPQGVAR